MDLVRATLREHDRHSEPGPVRSSSARSRKSLYRDWEQLAEDVVALLRGDAGRDPYNSDLSALIGELTTRSDHFRTWWAAHNVRPHRTGVKNLHHLVVGDPT
ncbi:hypothetical protein [Actinoplanes sp. DH11]|uniref:MmyB family transcriptional regulator n=1 Tax=Actinoplanes sp. DH11 TaxID=2857011 RepID=UPI001E5531C8|nr:hypothetical protein [Actinoplanes sp. DH11]